MTYINNVFVVDHNYVYKDYQQQEQNEQQKIITDQMINQLQSQLPEQPSPNILPQKYKQLWITNKRLIKQLNILKLQLQEKDRIIRQLKIQIDSTILQDTKNRLEYLRIMEDQVNQKTKDVRQEYIIKIAEIEARVEGELREKFGVQQELRLEKDKNQRLEQKIQEFKLHVIMALDEKDLIIKQLQTIINCQDRELHLINPKQNENFYQTQKNNSLKQDKQLRTQRIPVKEQANKATKVHIKRNI